MADLTGSRDSTIRLLYGYTLALVLALLLVTLLGGCSTATLAPTAAGTLVDDNGVLHVPPPPPPPTPAPDPAPIPGPVPTPIADIDLSCATRDAEVAAYVARGGALPTIITLGSGRKVYVVDTAGGYTITDYPLPWCSPS